MGKMHQINLSGEKIVLYHSKIAQNVYIYIFTFLQVNMFVL